MVDLQNVEREKLNYPIKYAIMPVEEQTGWATGLNELVRDYSVVANIVMKCYVIGKNINFKKDGSYQNQYEVVFLYGPERYSRSFEPTVPSFSIYYQCTNSTIVDQVFDSFEEAKTVATEKNGKIFRRATLRLSIEHYGEQLKLLREDYQRVLDKYEIVESSVEEQTSDVTISQPHSVILEDVLKKILDKPEDFYSKLSQALPAREREFLKRAIKDKSCKNCTNVDCRIEQCDKASIDETGKQQDSKCISWNNEELIGRQFILEQTN